MASSRLSWLVYPSSESVSDPLSEYWSRESCVLVSSANTLLSVTSCRIVLYSSPSLWENIGGRAQSLTGQEEMGRWLEHKECPHPSVVGWLRRERQCGQTRADQTVSSDADNMDVDAQVVASASSKRSKGKFGETNEVRLQAPMAGLDQDWLP